MFFLPWWLLLVCLVVSALATYLLLESTQAGDSPWALYPLTALLQPFSKRMNLSEKGTPSFQRLATKELIAEC